MNDSIFTQSENVLVQWNISAERGGLVYYTCPICGYADVVDKEDSHIQRHYHFCPGCGTNMIRKKGKWIHKFASNGWMDHTCSVCGYTENTDVHVHVGFDYCPSCGAIMKED